MQQKEFLIHMQQTKQSYHVHYAPVQGFSQIDFKELWRYKDLIWLFVKRDFTVMYKQTVLGPAWILINPLMTTLMYTVMFGTIANPGTAVYIDSGFLIRWICRRKSS